MAVAFVSHPRLIEHRTGAAHPERPDRLRAIHQAVRDAGLIDSPTPFPEFAVEFSIEFGLERRDDVKLIEIEAVPADREFVLLAHTEAHLRRIEEICGTGGGMLDGGDTPVGRNGVEMGLLSLGSAIGACDAVMSGRATRAFSATRPPGHHAEPDRSMGFCLFSNAAIAARYAQQRYRLKRIAIVDFDVHHGNGTQAVFVGDPSVLFISMHQHPDTCYPGSGYANETGTGAGEGFTINLPLPRGGGDEIYFDTIERRVLPALDGFRPELLMFSAGFDAHHEDPLANMNVTDDGFETVTRMLCDAANRFCRGRVVSILEGGYQLTALGRSVVKHLRAMSR